MAGVRWPVLVGLCSVPRTRCLAGGLGCVAGARGPVLCIRCSVPCGGVRGSVAVVDMVVLGGWCPVGGVSWAAQRLGIGARPPITCHRSLATEHRPPNIAHREHLASTTAHSVQVTCRGQRGAGHRRHATEQRPPNTGHRAPATKPRSPDIGHRVAATVHRTLGPGTKHLPPMSGY